MLNILLCTRQTHNTASGEVETLCSALAHTGASQVLTTELLKRCLWDKCERRKLAFG